MRPVTAPATTAALVAVLFVYTFFEGVTAADCPYIPAPEGGSVECPAASSGWCNQECDSDHTLYGQPYRQCTQGSWLPEGDVYCVPTCPFVSPPTNGYGECEATDDYTKYCNQSCDPGYALQGDHLRRCANGTWLGTQVSCIPECPTVYAPANSPSTDCPATTNYGEKCDMSCNSGYDLVPDASASRTCQSSGAWTGTDISCIPECPQVDAPDGGIPQCDATTANGDECNQYCLEGYFLTAGTPNRTCVDGVWTGSDVVCTARCPAVPAPDHGWPPCPATIDTSATCEQHCNASYRLQGTPSRTCTGGEWTGTDVNCTIECPYLPAPANGAGDCPATIQEGKTCTQSCDSGTRPLGDTVLTCTNGVWVGNPLTCPLECPAVPAPTDGSVDCPATILYNSTCAQECDAGYRLEGDGLRNCTPAGVWDGVAVSCVQCPAIAAPSNGGPTCPATDVLGATCDQSCDSGYAATGGDESRTCGAGGVWSGNDLVCEPECPYVPTPVNGLYDCPATTVNNQLCVQDCRAGFAQSAGATTRSCQDGSWTLTALECAPECPDIETPDGGVGSCSATINDGAKCTITCQAGHRQFGDVNRWCYNGTWNGTEVTCAPECPVVTTPDHGSGYCNATIVDSTVCTQSCDPGTRVSGDTSRTCTAGSWSGTQLRCDPECPAVTAPTDGSGFCPATIVNGTQCNQACDSGYRLNGTASRVCREGKWDGVPVNCNAECPTVPPPTDGYVSCPATIVDGTECIQLCDPGYMRVGDNRTCNNGVWSGTAVTCVQCPNVPPPTNGFVDCPVTDVRGEWCNQTCDVGYYTAGSTARQCYDGSWTGTDVTCLPECASVPPPANGSTTAGCVATTTHGAACDQACDSGFRLLGDASRTCDTTVGTGEWSGTPVSCAPECPLVPTPAYSSSAACPATIVDSTTCVQGCDPGSRLLGNATRTCTKGEWSGVAVSCPLECPAVPAPTNGSGYCAATINNGANCVQACDPGWQLVGSFSRTCTDGVWDGTPVQCVRCPAIPAPEYAASGDCGTAVNGENCTHSCLSGYRANGTAVRMCNDGVWSGVPFECIPECPNVPRPYGGRPRCRPTIDYSDTCEQSCDPGYVKTSGTDVRPCQSDGSWGGTNVQCAPYCYNITAPPNGVGGCAGTIVNGTSCSAVNISCNSGFYLCGTGLSCYAGQWQGVYPTCRFCPELFAPPNGAGHCPRTDVPGVRCNQTCNEGFVLNGTASRVCDMCNYNWPYGYGWSGDRVECVPECPYVPVPQFGTPGEECNATIVNGTWCNQTCQYGYRLFGDASRVCHGGKWNGPNVTCVPECQRVAPPRYGNVNCPATITDGVWCNQTCDEGYRPFGSAARVCNNGLWSGEDRSCVPECPVVLPPANGSVLCTATINETAWCNQTCDPGFQLVGTAGRRCDNGTWLGQEVTCVRCPRVPEPTWGGPNCSYAVNDEFCVQGCDSGHRLLGDASRECVDGVWQGTQVSCPFECPTVPAPPDGSPTCPATIVDGTKCVQSCDPGHRLLGNATRNCTRGVWSGDAVSCPPECPAVSPPAQGSGYCGPTINNGDTCVQQCAPGWKLLGTPTRFCQDGAWNGTQVSCVRCPTVDVPGNGSVYCNFTHLDGRWCNQTCDDGYRLFGTADRVCIDGVWQGTDVSCVPECQPVPPPFHGTGFCPATVTYTDTCDQACDSGYRLGGDNSRRCLPHGQWQGTRVWCDPECPLVAAPDDGAVACPATITNGTWCNQTCDPGFRLFGNDSRTCFNGVWSGADVSCVPECPAVPPPTNGSVYCPATVDTSATCEQICDSGWQIQGTATRTCTNGAWTGTQVYCVRCPEIPAPEFGGPHCDTGVNGEVCNQTCNAGHRLLGTQLRTCTDGVWSGTDVSCPYECPTVDPPVDGSGNCPATINNGETCVQSCDAGHRLLGNSTRECTDGVWSGTEVTCPPECPNVIAPIGGGDACPATIADGTWCNQTCDPGYAIYSGSFDRVCNNGAWSGTQLICTEECPAVPAPWRGGPACSETIVDSTVCEQHCDAGYAPASGNEYRTCFDGVWSGTQLDCEPACPAVAAPAAGNPPCPLTIVNGTWCNQTCDAGYRLLGSSARACDNGAWTGTDVTCAPECPAIPAPANGQPNCPATIVNGDTCEQNCTEPYLPFNSPVRTCNTGSWSGNALECRSQCPAVPKPENGITNVGASNCSATIDYGQVCTQACNSGYALTGDASRTCFNGAWTGSQVVCVPECPNVPATEGTPGACPRTTVNGAICDQTCVAGYANVSGNEIRECQDGVWSGTAVDCDIECPTLTQPANGSPTCPATPYIGTECTQTCDFHYQRTAGDETRTCMAGGVWSGSDVVCTLECLYVPPPQFGAVECPATTTVGDTCSQTCNTGYRLNGTATRTCLASGEWSGAAVECIPECPYLDPPINGAGVCEATVTDGDVCVQTCLSGFDFYGEANRTCVNGTWEGQEVTCTDCGAYDNCADCMGSDPHCGWCASTRTCEAGASAGPFGTTCDADWVFPVSEITSTATTSPGAIVPNVISATLRPRTPLTLPVTVRTIRLPLDLYLLQDLSNSFEDDLPVLQALAPSLIAQLQAQLTPDTWFGIGAFVDKPAGIFGYATDYTYEHKLSISNDTDAIIDGMNDLSSSPISGGDLPEAQLEGLYQSVSCKSTVGWRTGARHMVMLSTDAWFHSRGEGVNYYNLLEWGTASPASYLLANNGDCVVDDYEDYPNIWQVRQACVTYNVIPIFALANAGESINPQYEELVDVIGFGSYVELNSNSSNLVAAIREGYEDASKTITMAVSVDEYELVGSISPESGYTNVPLDTERAFEIELEWDGSDAPDVTEVTLSVLGFGEVTITATLLSACNCSGIACPVDEYNNTCGGQGDCNCGACYCYDPYDGVDCTCDTSLPCTGLNGCSGHGACECGACACDLGWSGEQCNCSAAACLPTCVPPFGECVCGECQCYGNWEGVGCDCSSDPCPANCTYPQGSCECGLCECASGWTGDQCDCTTEPCPGLCNGNGDCSCGECVCDAGWSGDECACSTDPCTDPTCSGHGDCECGECVCDPLWTGETCDCFNIPCLNNCTYPQGVCDCGECVCAPGFSGPDCSCDDTLTCLNDCTPPNGACECGECECNTGYYGDDCACPLVCPNSCSGNGDCDCGVCTCDDGWTGEDCSCLDQECPNNCSYPNGVCDCGVCTCAAGWSTPESGCNCSSDPCPDNCFGNGDCVCGVCECNSGFEPPSCSCPAATTCPDDCSGHGVCDCGCNCFAGWGADNCNCSLSPCVGTNDCSGNGDCVCDECVCYGNYTGSDCSCDAGKACPVGTDGLECSGNGVCDGCGNCVCDAAYVGTDDCSCSLLPCSPDSDCSGNGVCDCGVCNCTAPYTGDSCECDPTLTCTPGCGVNGTCVCGDCVCDEGYIDSGGVPCSKCIGSDKQCGNVEVSGCSLLSCESCLADNDCVYCSDDGECYDDGSEPGSCEVAAACEEGLIDVLARPEVAGGTALAIMLLIGLIVLAVLALLNYLRNKKLYQDWLDEHATPLFALDENPLFKAQNEEFANPLYNVDAKDDDLDQL